MGTKTETSLNGYKVKLQIISSVCSLVSVTGVTFHSMWPTYGIRDFVDTSSNTAYYFRATLRYSLKSSYPAGFENYCSRYYTIWKFWKHLYRYLLTTFYHHRIIIIMIVNRTYNNNFTSNNFTTYFSCFFCMDIMCYQLKVSYDMIL